MVPNLESRGLGLPSNLLKLLNETHEDANHRCVFCRVKGMAQIGFTSDTAHFAHVVECPCLIMIKSLMNTMFGDLNEIVIRKIISEFANLSEREIWDEMNIEDFDFFRYSIKTPKDSNMHTKSVYVCRRGDTVSSWSHVDHKSQSYIYLDRDIKNIKILCKNRHAFAVLLKDGSVRSWGLKTTGGDMSEVASELSSDIVNLESDNGLRFVATKANGVKVSWGYDYD